MTSIVILLALMAIFTGPTARRARTGGPPAPTPMEPRERAREVLARHLDVRRSEAGREPEAEAPEPAPEAAPGPWTVDLDRGCISTIGGWIPISIWLRHQACGLQESWEREVLGAATGLLPRALSRVARRGGATFRALAPDLATEFDGLRERLHSHSGNGPPMSDAEFVATFERMEALVTIAERRARELIERLDPARRREAASTSGG